MTKLLSVKPDRVIRALLKKGYFKKEGAKHTIIHDGRQIITTVPRGRKPIKSGTLRGILKDAGIGINEFLNLL